MNEQPTSPPRNRVLLVAIVGLVAIAALVGWKVLGRQHATADTSTAGHDVPHLDGKLIRFSASFAKRAGLTSEPATMRKLVPVLELNGTVTYDSRKFAAIGARTAGRVAKVWKLVGEDVKPQEVVAEIHSVALGKAEAQLLAAKAKELAAAAQMKRERALADAHVASERDAEHARMEHEVAKAERMAAEIAVQALGGQPGGREPGMLHVRSPIAGKVITSKISRGKTVDPTDTIYEIADLSDVWVELGVFERDLAALRLGDRVEIFNQVNRAGSLAGHVDYIAHVVDPKTRTAGVRVAVKNVDNALRPGQSVQARIHTAGLTGEQLCVPKLSVTRVDGKPVIFVMLAKDAVETRPVSLGAEDGEQVAVMGGVKAGERVVVGGVFELKSELFR
jgi:membrane fusion protein, heavy metal efflux system